jgi:hypothetical protein
VKPSHMVCPVFDDPNLVSVAGLVPVLRLAQAAGLPGLLAGVTVPSPNVVVKTTSVVAAMLAGADCIDDTDVLRHGGMGRLFTGVRAPSTLGTFLRSFTHGHVQQLDRAGAGLLAGLGRKVPGLLPGTSSTITGAGGSAGAVVYLDVDDTVREVHGYAKQSAAFGYTGVRGLNVQVGTISSPTAAPVIARARLRRGNTASAAGAGRLLAQTISTARAAGVRAPLLARADSAYYGYAFVGTALRHQAWFSVTARMTPAVTRAIATIPAGAWTPIRYPQAVFDDAEGRWVSDAEVAEVDFVAFTGRRKAEHVPCRLVVRRVRRLQPLASDGTAQGELFATYRHHAFITNTTMPTVAADEVHRGHAIVEQVIAEIKDGALAHLPSGRYAANAAWVSCAVMAFNLARAAAVAAAMPTARWATVRTRLIGVPARLAATGRRLVLHLPTHWPWSTAWKQLWNTATGPPRQQLT